MKFFVAITALAAAVAASPLKEPTIDRSDSPACKACAEKCSEGSGPIAGLACRAVSCVTACTDILPTITI
ncbi:hypothetical protein VHEMI03027 [[Torrubiella] hemipterigena]|uniref:Uncharacterized protein n=1 Tax=[Torrubiella] hemipterigena TaxID=1531966 RepID=A0A0A1SXC8_9HYPO|nr:hypothetical protein VHEMI03027 [[Torrubiella] hemipterigena]